MATSALTHPPNAELARRVYETIYEGTESFDGNGQHIAYLVGSILCCAAGIEYHVPLDESEQEFIDLLRELFAPEDAIWQYISLVVDEPEPEPQPTGWDVLVPFVSYVVDDALNGRKLGEDQHAIVRSAATGHTHRSRLVAWQCGFEPIAVAVHSYLDCELSDEEAIELATDYLSEINWFAYGATEPESCI